MVFRLQYLLLISLLSGAALAQDNKDQAALEFDREFFSVGVYAGILSIQDYRSELAFGVQSSFKASEDFFLQFNYLQADASYSSFELSQGPSFAGSNRTFSHYDFLLGYNLFQAEFFGDGPESAISSLYLVAGAGETEFGGENNFTITIGTGYQFALKRRYVLSLDFRDHIFKSSLLEEDKNTHNTQVSAGISFLF